MLIEKGQTGHSIILDALNESNLPLRLEKLFIHSRTLSGSILRKILPVVQKLSELVIRCNKVEDEEALQRIYEIATNLVTIKFIRFAGMSSIFNTVCKKILNAVRDHQKLEYVEIHSVENFPMKPDEIRQAVQCVRHWRVLVKFGKLLFLHGKCVSSRTNQVCRTVSCG